MIGNGDKIKFHKVTILTKCLFNLSRTMNIKTKLFNVKSI